MLTVAVNVRLQLGVNRFNARLQQYSLLETEIFNRTWWACFLIDRYVVIVTEQSFALLSTN
jgi:hypothetical protein